MSSLEPRFQKLENWQEADFKNPDTGHDIHYAFSIPESADKIIIVLPGLSEFTELYYETARDLLKRGHGVVIINWQYQGLSGRHPDNPHKRHSDGFETDISDLHALITSELKLNQKNLYMLAHSTGANIGLRFLAIHQNIFKAAAFSAPLLGIYGFGWLPLSAWQFISGLLKPFHTAYVPGGKDWCASARKSDGSDKFSSDPIRDTLHNGWCLSNPALQSGNATLGWVHEALKSMGILQKQETIDAIQIPCLFAIAGQDEIVDSKAALKFAQRVRNAKTLYLEKSKHEIFLETDDIRDEFFNAFDQLINSNH